MSDQSEQTPQLDRRGSWRRLPVNARLAAQTIRRAAPREYATLLVAACASSVALLALLFAGRNLIERLTSRVPPQDAVSLAAPLVVLAMGIAVAAVASVIQTEQRWLIAFLVEQEATGGIVEAAAVVPLTEFESPRFQDHLQRSLSQAVHRPWEITQAVSQLVASIAGCGAIALVLFTIQPLLIPAVMLAGVPIGLATERNSRELYDAIHAITPITREREYLQTVLTGRDEAKEVRVFGASDYLSRRYDDLYRREITALRRVSRMRIRRSMPANLGATAITITVLAALIVLSLRGVVSTADAAIGAVAVQQLAVRVRGVNGAISGIQEASLFLEDYADFVRRAQQVAAGSLAVGEPNGDRPMAPEDDSMAVELTDVWFTYPGASTPALRGVSLAVQPGRMVALVGANGSGKTTVAKLVCDLYQPQRGRVRWGQRGKPRIGVIFQDFVRFRFTAHDNIALGDPSRIDDVDHAVFSARAAQADHYLASLSRGYQTWLSPSFEGGTDLSVGQWQRVAMARALFRDAPLLVLDEPTASLDAVAERELIDGTRRAFADKAVLVISHRFANVVDADQIYVLDAGQVIEHGTHAELMRIDGRYAELYLLQASTFGVRVHD